MEGALTAVGSLVSEDFIGWERERERRRESTKLDRENEGGERERK